LEKRFFLDPCPDSVWELLPGGPVALNEALGERWQYMGSLSEANEVRHQFRHRAHPQFVNARLYAEVVDSDTGPELGEVCGELDFGDPGSEGDLVEPD
jgi:hypothetical protein